MCTLTVADFDALDIPDADAVLIVGEVIASEKRAENLRLSLFPFVKAPGGIIQRAIAGEMREQNKLLSQGQHVPGVTTGRVIVH